MNRTKGSRSEIGMLYQYGVTALLAAELSRNNRVDDYIIYSSENSAGKFDDIVAKVKLKEQDDWYLYLIQVKYKETKRLNVSDNVRGKRIEYFLSDYIQCFNDILSNSNLTCRHGIPDDNIRFSIFCDKGIQIPVFLRQGCTFQLSLCRHSEKSDLVNNGLFPFGNKYWKFVCKDLENSQFQHFFDKCCLYLEQPNYNKLNKLIEEACQTKNTKEIINYVKDYFNDDYLYKQGLRKEVFEIELQKIRVVDDILPITSFADLIDDNLLTIWNEITIKHDITAIDCMQNFAIEACLYSCLVKKVISLLDINTNWEICGSKKNNLGNELIQSFFSYSKTKRLRYWIDPPNTLRSLIIELWKCGDLPLILRTHTPLRNFERYAHLKRSYIILDDWADRSEEINSSKMDIFTSLSSIVNLELQDRILKDTLVSPQGRKPVTLKNLLGDDKELMSAFTCADILRIMRKRTPFLKEGYIKGSDYLAFIIEDEKCVEISDRIEPYAIGHNVRISCPPGRTDKCIDIIRGHANISHHYTIYHLRKTSDKLVLTQGNPQKLSHRFVDQYGDPVFISNTGECIPIIGQTIEPNELQYIPRQLRRVTLPRSFFSSKETQICVLSGDLNYFEHSIEFISVDDILNETISIQKKTYFVKIHEKGSRQYYWRKLCYLKYPIFDIYITGGKLELLRSKNCKNLNCQILYNGGIYSEPEFFNEINEESDEIAVVTGDAGIGKTSFLKLLCNTYCTKRYIVFYDLINLQVDLRKSEYQHIDLVDFIFKETQKGLPKQYTDFVCYLRRKKRLIWVLDSFDEIQLACEKQVLHLIDAIANSGAQIVVATRIENSKILMNHFAIRLMKIEPLEETDCLSYWELDQDLLKNVSYELATNPLYLNFLKMISINKEELVNITKYTLYEKVINMKVKHCLRTTYKILHDSDIAQAVLLFEKLALVALFGKEVIEKELLWPCDKKVFDMTKFGIVVRFDDDNYPIFYHRTFVEFLFAQWIAKACQIKIYKSAARYLYKQIFHENKLHILNILLEDEELHNTIVQTDICGLQTIIKENPGCWNIVDKLGRTALHAAIICCSYSNRLFASFEMLDIVIRSMLQNNSYIDKPDIIMNWDWSEYIQPEIFNFTYSFGKMEAVRIYLQLQRKKIEKYNCLPMVFPTKYFYSIFLWALKFGAIEMISDLVLLQNFENKIFYNFYQACLGLVPECNFSWTESLRFEGQLTPIHIACIYGSVSMIQHLIKAGINVNDIDIFTCTPLHYSIMRCCLVNTNRSKNADAVKLLLRAHANPNSLILRVNEISPLCLAIQAKDNHVVRMLLATGANVRHRCASGDTPLHFAVNSGSSDIVQCLLRSDAPQYFKNEHNDRAIDIALKHNHTEIVNLLNKKKDAVNVEQEDIRAVYVCTKTCVGVGASPLHHAAYSGNINLIKALLRRGANINVRNKTGCTALHVALHTKNVEVIRFLLDTGADAGVQGRYGSTPLLIAVEYCINDVVEMILEKGVNVNVANIIQQTPLHSTIVKNNVKIVELLLDKGANINFKHINGVTPLHVATELGHEHIVRLLLDKGANMEIQDVTGLTPLYVSIKERHKSITKLLLEKGANTNIQNKQGRTALLLSIYLKDIDLVRLLLDKGANVNEEDVNGYTPLFMGADSGSEEMMKLLLEKGGNANAITKSGLSVLYVASKLEQMHLVNLLLKSNINIDRKGGGAALGFATTIGDINMVKLLLNRGVSVHACDEEDGHTPLHIAAVKDYVNIAELLLENGAQINANCRKCSTPLHQAVTTKNKNIVKLLIKKGADVNAKYQDGPTILLTAIKTRDINIVEILLEASANIDGAAGIKAIICAICVGNINIVKILINKGINVNAYDEYEYTPFYIAVATGRTDIVEFLLENGANVNIPSENGIVPLMRTVKDGHIEIARLLLDKGANVDIYDGEFTPLFLKTCQGDVDFVKLLVQKGANTNIRTKHGINALQMAICLGHDDIVEVLLQAGADVNIQTSDGDSFLWYTAQKENTRVVDLLLNKGVSLITDSVNHSSIFHDCAREGNVNILNVLLQRKFNLNVQDKTGNTALHISVIERNAAVVKLLLEHNADCDIANINGETPFKIIVDKVCTDVDSSNSGDFKNREGIKIISLILKNMKKIDDKHEAVIKSFYWAAEKGYLEIVKLLLHHGININIQNQHGYTPLHTAVVNNNEDIVEKLLENGANVCMKTNDGYTPLCLANLKRHTNIAEFLTAFILSLSTI